MLREGPASGSCPIIVKTSHGISCTALSVLENAAKQVRRTHRKIQTQGTKPPLQTTKEQTQQQAPKATLNPACLPLQCPSFLNRKPR